jgi:Spy/CpxP family protein refolding chaperone
MLKKVFMVGGTMVALALASAAIAGPGGPGGQGPVRRVLQELDLSEEQRTEIRGIFEEARAEHESIREGLDGVRGRFRAELAKPSPSATALHAIVDERAALETQLAHDRVDDLLEVHAVLTEDQRAELARLLEEFEGRRGEGPGPRGPQGGPPPEGGGPRRGR